MAINTNIDPYYDDWEQAGTDGVAPIHKYHRVLFRPGYAVQARELTQLQTMLQSQIARFGNHMFSEGSVVIPGGFSINNKTPYVVVDSITATNVLGETAVGQTSGVRAKVVAGIEAFDVYNETIYVSYVDSGDSNTAKTFQEGETIVFEESGEEAVVHTTTEASPVPAMGVGVTASIQSGVYFVRGLFGAVPSSTIVIEPYTQYASADIGLEIAEKIATPADDTNLNDNANGAPNYAAPGAHRLEMKLALVWQPTVDPNNKDFISLGRIANGTVLKEVRNSDYSVIEKTLARRTFDESGNYTVRPFKMSMLEHADVYSPGDEAKLLAAVEPSKAYVQGYEIETIATSYVDVDKARDYTLFESASVPVQLGNSIVVSNMSGIPAIGTYDDMELRISGSTRGYARVRSIVGLGSGRYRLFLFDIRMNVGYAFENVSTVYTAGAPPFSADVELVNGRAILENTTRNTMVFKLPFDRVRTLDSETDDTAQSNFNYIYYVTREVQPTSSTVAGGSMQFNSFASELFEPFDDENFILTVASGSSNGDIVPLVLWSSGETAPAVEISSDSETCTIRNLDAYEDESVRLIANMKRSMNHKTKTIDIHQTIISVQSVVESSIIPLERADCRRILGIWMSPSFSTTPTASMEEVSEYYNIHSGQRDNFYGIGSISLKQNTAFRPSGQLMIRYEYFEHSGSGDFFCVDSYANLYESNPLTGALDVPVSYEDFPTFVSNVHGEVELRSCIDFRPRVGDNGSNFTGTGSDYSVCPESATTLTTDIQYYLNRIDKVCLDESGRFGVVQGVSALDPQEPADPKGSMVLYHLYVQAYTEGPQEVGIKIIDNKRYTMRDIGKLDRRINNLEYYTSLSLLEAETASKQIQDETTGLDRFKNGFLVDSFTTHRLGNVIDPDYRIAIDRESNAIRPLFSEDSVQLKFNSTDSVNVEKNGDLITLPIVEEVIESSQTKASGVINVNPNQVFNWYGKIELSPATDNWKDTSRRPNVVVNQEGVYDAMLATIEATDALGTVWNEWQTNWTGVESTSQEDKSKLQTKTGSNWKKTGYTYTTTTTTVTTDYQSRTGTETFATPATYNTNLGDRVVEINFSPFMRSRTIKFKATRMKPNTTVYAFFDSRSVASYVRQITEAEYTLWSDTDNETLVGKNNYTAHPEGATTLQTDDAGTLYGEFFIPNNDTIYFTTGTKLLELTDDANNDATFETTRAKGSYRAEGLIETSENVTISTRVPEIEYREVSGDRTVSDTSSTTDTRWDQVSYTSWSNSSSGGSSSYSGGSSSGGGYPLHEIEGTVNYTAYNTSSIGSAYSYSNSAGSTSSSVPGSNGGNAAGGYSYGGW